MHRESCGIFGLGDGILGEFLARLESLREVVSDIKYFYLRSGLVTKVLFSKLKVIVSYSEIPSLNLRVTVTYKP